MRNSKIMRGLLGLAYAGMLAACAYAGAEWDDVYYPFRVPIEVQVPAAGEYLLDLTAGEITAWVNEQADFRFRPDLFAFENVRLVEIDAGGNVIDADVEAGFRYVPGAELVVNGDFEQQAEGVPLGWEISAPGFALEQTSHDASWCMTATGEDRHACQQQVATEKNTWYRFAGWTRGSVACGPYITPAEGVWRLVRHSWQDPFSPPDRWVRREVFFNTGEKQNWLRDELVIRLERQTGAVDDLSLQACAQGFVLHAASAGRKRYRLYYSPLEGITPSTPGTLAARLPTQVLQAERAGNPEWLDSGLEYALHDDALGEVWFASSLLKLQERSPAPAARRESIRLSCAKNESEAFQIVFKPRAAGEIQSIRADLAGPGGYRLNEAQIEIRRAHFVPIESPSLTGYNNHEPARSEFTGRLPDPLPRFKPAAFSADDPNLIIWIDVAIPAEAPAGGYRGGIIIETNAGPIGIPLELIVRSFALPATVSCRSAIQQIYYGNEHLFSFHKVSTGDEKYTLSRDYIAALARYKLSEPSPTAAYPWRADADMSQTTAPLAAELPWALDTLHLTGYRVEHYSGHTLPAEAAAQTEPIAAYLEEHGWLERSYIQIDEPPVANFAGVRAWIDTFKTQPHARQIDMFAFTYHAEAWTALRDHIDILVASNNDFDNSASPAAIEQWPKDKEVWLYWTNSSHIFIDTPALDQRLMAPKAWWLGARGLALPGFAIWWTAPGWSPVHNPWADPRTAWGNGVYAYFYPPDPRGTELPEKNTEIVPSLRLLLLRDGIEDFEYATLLTWMLESPAIPAAARDEGEAALGMFRRQFATPVSWTLSEAHWARVREAMGEAIEAIQAAQGNE